MIKNTVRSIKVLKTLIASMILSTVLVVTFSFLVSSLGDQFLSHDKLQTALVFYIMSKLTNPFNTYTDKKIQATQSIVDVRNIESEESYSETSGQITEKNSFHKNVLGASVQIPVVMLHYVRVNPDPNDKIGFNLSVTPYNFAKQMDYLVQHGYHTVSLDELGAALLHGTSLPPKPIALTFDDGYEDSYSQAYPILKARGLQALNFIITGFVGAPGYLTWDEILSMQKSGVFSFGAHTVTHKPLTSLSYNQVLNEVTDSRRELQSHLHTPVYWFAYPFGNVNNTVASIVQQSGYVGAFGTNSGTFLSADRMFTLPRVRDGGGLGVADFASYLPWK